MIPLNFSLLSRWIYWGRFSGTWVRGYLETHGWLKGSFIARESTSAWVTKHENYVSGGSWITDWSVGDSHTRNLYYLGNPWVGGLMNPVSFRNILSLVSCFNSHLYFILHDNWQMTPKQSFQTSNRNPQKDLISFFPYQRHACHPFLVNGGKKI